MAGLVSMARLISEAAAVVIIWRWFIGFLLNEVEVESQPVRAAGRCSPVERQSADGDGSYTPHKKIFLGPPLAGSLHSQRIAECP
jgi:hypothetical protein